MLHILLVEDESAIRVMLRDFLRSQGYSVQEAKDTYEADDLLRDKNTDLIVLDWMLPRRSGQQWLKSLRQSTLYKDIPVLMLTARSEETDMVSALEYGADDYMTKPVSMRALLARVKALLRRSQGSSLENILIRGDLALDPSHNELKIRGEHVKIGLTEFRLLHYFMKTTDRIHTRSHLLDQVWGQNAYIEERTVDVHILRLRKILKAYGVGEMVQTVRGLGYRFTENVNV